MMQNRSVILASRPEGSVKPENFALVEGAVPEPASGQLLIENLYLSIDPGIRNLLGAREGYLPPIPIGSAMSGSVLGRVLKSHHPDFSAGDIVVGRGTYADFSLITPNALCWKIDTSIVTSLSTALGILGLTGLTAYFGLRERGKPIPGETVLVSGAAGAAGSAVGQIARIMGCRAIGMAGGREKCARLVDDFGFDGAIDYRGKDAIELSSAIAHACPNGVDVFFDNVGGTVLDAALANINQNARVVLCGLISQYDGAPPPPLTNLFNVIAKTARIEGFLLTQFADRFPEGIRDLQGWVSNGRLRFREEILGGIEQAIPAFIGLFSSANQGKVMVRLK